MLQLTLIDDITSWIKGNKVCFCNQIQIEDQWFLKSVSLDSHQEDLQAGRDNLVLVRKWKTPEVFQRFGEGSLLWHIGYFRGLYKVLMISVKATDFQLLHKI